MSQRSSQKTFLRMVALLLGLLSLSGCSPEAPLSSTGVVFVVGNRANSPEITFDDVADAIDSTVKEVKDRRTNNLSLTLVQADGYPLAMPTLQHSEPDSVGVATRERERQGFIEALKAQFAETRADDTEVATLDAISLAADLTKGSDRRLIYVFDSGLSTSGLLPLTEGRFGADPVDVVDRLTSDDLLPNLEGVEMVWRGLGEVSGSQPKLDASAQNTLRSLWTYVINSAGGTVTFEAGWAGGSPVSKLPAVSTVDIPAYVAPVMKECRTVLGSNTLRFYPDSSEFIDPQAARALSKQIAESLGQCLGCPLVIGTTSSFGTEEGRAKFSAERAEAFGQLLAADLPPNSRCTIATRGVGMNFDGYIEDRDASGILIEQLATENRLIIVDFV